MSETDSTKPSPDPRTAEVLRVVQRAKGTVSAELGPSLRRPDLADGLVMLREALSNRSAGLKEGMESLVSTVRGLEGVLVTSTDKAAELHRGQERSLRELRDSVQGLKHQVDTLARRQAWWARLVVAGGLILGLLLAGVITLAWRTRAVALDTHAVLVQILENQARLQAAKSGKRR
jgi:cell division protein FtsB